MRSMRTMLATFLVLVLMVASFQSACAGYKAAQRKGTAVDHAVSETFLNIPGLAQLMVNSISRRDDYVIQAIVLLMFWVRACPRPHPAGAISSARASR